MLGHLGILTQTKKSVYVLCNRDNNLSLEIKSFGKDNMRKVEYETLNAQEKQLVSNICRVILNKEQSRLAQGRAGKVDIEENIEMRNIKITNSKKISENSIRISIKQKLMLAKRVKDRKEANDLIEYCVKYRMQVFNISKEEAMIAEKNEFELIFTSLITSDIAERNRLMKLFGI